MTHNDYNEDEVKHIVEQHTRRLDYLRDYKKMNPPTQTQRAKWNKAHYERRKHRDNHKEQQLIYYENSLASRKHQSRIYYYKKTNNLEKLKLRYPDSYEIFMARQ